MIELTSKQRKVLEKYANSIDPVVIVGQYGVSETLIGKVEESLTAHELIKVKFNEFKDEKHELSKQICEQTNATLIRVIGNVAIIYREAEEEKDRKYKF